MNMFINEEPPSDAVAEHFGIFWNGVVWASLATAALAAMTLIVGGGAVYIALFLWPFVGSLAFAVGIAQRLEPEETPK